MKGVLYIDDDGKKIVYDSCESIGHGERHQAILFLEEKDSSKRQQEMLKCISPMAELIIFYDDIKKYLI